MFGMIINLHCKTTKYAHKKTEKIYFLGEWRQKFLKN